MNATELAQRIKGAAIECGYADCGITSTEPFVEFEKGVEQRMELFPDAAHFYQPMLSRVYPRKSYPWAASIVVCVRDYGKYKAPDELEGRIGRSYQFHRTHPEGPDYNKTAQFEQKLESFGLRFERAEGGQLPERWAAARAGVASFGRSNFVFSEPHGSWINILPWFVDAELPPDTPSLEISCPENCTTCIKACPTGALSAPFGMRMDRCIAYLTYRGPGPSDGETERQMGEWIYGCDVCQEVCPRNKGKLLENEQPYWLEALLPYLSPSALANMDLTTYRQKVHPLFWYIDDSPAGLERWRANAMRSLANAAGKGGKGE